MSSFTERIAKLPPKRVALLAIELQAELDALRRRQREPVAIVGVGCRLPRAANDPAAFWRLLADGVDAISEVPADRWDVDAYYAADPDAAGKTYSRWGGFLEGLDRFDAEFFNMAPREAVSLDPQQRLLLEVSWEALESAAQRPESIMGSRTGVFVGMSGSEYLPSRHRDISELDAHSGTGNAASMAAGRLSYTLGLQGPSLTVDTACSSSLVAVHLACQSLRAGECRLALAGGVNLMLSPETNVVLSRARMLASDGRCKTFDASADGYVRGEGCAIVVLKRLSDAVADGDRVLALVRGSAVNQDGRSGGLTVPNGSAQEALIREALEQASVGPADVAYVEAHGTGTSLGDPIEVRALGAALGAGRAAADPLLIGSVKTNLGHLEAAAGVVGLVKVVLALGHEEIPPHLHFKTPNPHVAWTELPVKVAAARTPWRRGAKPRIAGVSAFGFSGTNAHVVVEEAPVAAAHTSEVERPAHVLALSARTDAALQDLVDRYVEHVAAHPDEPVADICATAARGRTHFDCRLACIVSSSAELRRTLDRWRADRSDSAISTVFTGRMTTADALEVAWSFGGEGAQYAGMGRELYRTQPTFRAALDRCAAILASELDVPLVDLLYGDAAGRLSEPAYAQPALFAVEHALAELWRTWGVRPTVVLGQGVGEYAAACAAGVFSLEDGLRLVAARDRDAAAAQVRYQSPQIGLISSATGTMATAEELAGPGYWRDRSRARLPLDRALETARRNGVRAMLEIGSQAMPIGASGRAASDSPLLRLPSPRSDGSDWAVLLDAIARLYTNGAAIDWTAFDRDYSRRRLALPTYPFQRERHWLDRRTDSAPVESRERRDLIYELVWRQIEGAAAAPDAADSRAPWLIFADRGGVAAAIAKALAAKGAASALVFAGDGYRLRSDGALDIRPVDADEFRRAIEHATSAHGACANVLFLWPLDDRTGTTASASDLDEAQRLGLRALVPLTQAIVARPPSAAPARLVIATRHAQPAPPMAAPVGVAQAGVWGLGRVIALEHPDLAVRLVDLEPAALDEQARVLLDEMSRGRGADDEDQVAIRGSRRYAPRLAAVPPQPAGAPGLSADATYLIAGGLGALGLRTARWLADRGARHLILVGRRSRSVDAVADLRARGVEVRIESADIADVDAITAVIGRARTGAHPLRGVVHAAGLSTERSIRDLEAGAIDEVLRAKLAGAWNLHRLTEDLPLDFFLLFSSIASVWGSATLGHYAAANHCLDALAHHRRASGLPALAVNWGPWAGGGMATAATQDALAAIGVRALDPAAALDALAALASGDRAQVTIADVDWPRFKSVFAARGRRRLLDEVGDAAASDAGAQASAAAAEQRQLAALDPEARLAKLTAWVAEEVAAALGRSADRAPGRDERFFDIGMDSIMTVDVRRRLERRFGAVLAPTVAFDYPTIARLAAHVSAAIGLAGDEAPADGESTEAAPSLTKMTKLAEMSDEEVERLFAQKVLARDI